MLLRTFISAMTVLVFAGLVLAKYSQDYRFITDQVEQWLGSDLWLHALGGLLLPLAGFRLLRMRLANTWLQVGFLIAVMAIFSFDEWLQTFVANRHASWADWFFSTGGWLLAVVVLLISSVVCRFRASKRTF